VLRALGELNLVELDAMVPQDMLKSLFALVNGCDTLVRANVHVDHRDASPWPGISLSERVHAGHRRRFREFGHATQDQWDEGFSSLERISVAGTSIPPKPTPASACVRHLTTVSTEHRSLLLAHVFPALESLKLDTCRRDLSSLERGSVILPQSLTSLTILSQDDKSTLPGVASFLQRATNSNGLPSLNRIRFECGIDALRPLLQLRSTLTELEVTGLVPKGTGAIIGQLSALRHLKVPMMARENEPADDDATFLLSSRLRCLRTLRISTLRGTSLADVGAACPKLHKVTTSQKMAAAEFWRAGEGGNSPAMSYCYEWPTLRASFASA